MSQAYPPPPPPPPPAAPPVYPQELEEDPKQVARFRIGSGWFYWIGGITIVNTLFFLHGVERFTLFGLGVVQVFNQILAEIGTGPVALALAFVFGLIAAGVFIALGLLARKRMLWAYWLGIVLYLLDSLLVILLMLLGGEHSILFILFRIYVNFGLISGALALGRLKAANPAV